MKRSEALTLHECPHGSTWLPNEDYPSGRVSCRTCGVDIPGVEYVPASQLQGAVERIADLEEALSWALAYIDRPDDSWCAEEQENYDGAERVLDARLGGQ